MTVSIATINAMVAAGASAEVIAAAWKAEIEATEKAAEDRRAKDRDRQRSHRASRDVTACHSDNAIVTGSHADPPPNDNISNPPPPEKPTPDGVGKKPAKPRTPDFDVPDWIPAEPWAAFAAMRKRKSKPLDSFVAKQLFGRLRSIADAGWSLEDVITKAAIGNHDGFWMPDGRDSNIRRSASSGKGGYVPKTADELERAIRLADEKGWETDAEKYRKQMAALRAVPPDDPKVASIVRGVAGSLSARQAAGSQ